MQELFAFFFKFRPFFFEKGTIRFQWMPEGWVLLLILGGVLMSLLLIYRTTIQRRGVRKGWLPGVLRLGFVLLLLTLLARPTLLLPTVVARQQLLAVLIDNSASMSLVEQGVSRGEMVTRLLSPGSSFAGQLEDKFLLRWLAFDTSPEPMESPETLRWQGEQTNISSALEAVSAETRNLPLGGVVLITDGADNSFRSNTRALEELKSRDVPIHTIGVGALEHQRDVEILQVSMAPFLMPATVTSARVIFRHDGFGGSRGKLNVSEDGKLVKSVEVHFPRDSDSLTVDLNLLSGTPGVKVFEFKLQPLEGEEIVENNARQTLIEVRDSRPRILYVEGRPRWEYKFIRQALAEDSSLRLETLLRTALNKFYRQGIEEETTLAAGFPSRREDLFQYYGLILGSVESAFFSFAQLEMIRDFVARRGGGFLMLGGSSSFSAGGYQNTPIEDVLPVWLSAAEHSDQRDSSAYRNQEVRLRLTPFGLQHASLQLAPDEKANEEAWQKMPLLSDWNRMREVKPGATVLAQIETDSAEKTPAAPLLASHRYGKGLSMALLTGSSWRWQMLQNHQDQSHETFWRQTLRWLVSAAKDPVSVETDRRIYSRNEPVRLRSEVNQPDFTPVNNARVEAIIHAPSAEQISLTLQWESKEEGVYRGEWTPAEDGIYRVEVTAHSPEKKHGTAATYFLTSTGHQEFFNSGQKQQYLQRLSQETGGRYYPISEAHRLPEEITIRESSSSVVTSHDLWDMPINFMVLLALLFGEWIWRKKEGLI